MKAAILAGCRTPFHRAGTGLAELTAAELGKAAVREALGRSGVRPDAVGHLVFGTVVHDIQAPNLAREVGLATLPPGVPAVTVSRACTSANQAIADACALIELGQADVVIAGGAESLSHVPILASRRLSRALAEASKVRGLASRLSPFRRLRPRDLLPVAPAIAEPSTGETMGLAAERMAKENGIRREDQDAWALRSHRLAAAGTADGRLPAEIAPLYLPPAYERVVAADNGIRPDTSLEALAALPPSSTGSTAR
jgi:acetyl-CoA acyltransferase